MVTAASMIQQERPRLAFIVAMIVLFIGEKRRRKALNDSMPALDSQTIVAIVQSLGRIIQILCELLLVLFLFVGGMIHIQLFYFSC